MNSVEYLRELYAYNDWANRRVIRALKDAPHERSRLILAHSLVTQQAYFDRLHGTDLFGFETWQDLSLEECGDLARETAEKYERLLRRFDDEGLNLKINYRTSEGAWHENTFQELLSHVLFHSSIHRGNIVVLMREKNLTPPEIEYITYLREIKS